MLPEPQTRALPIAPVSPTSNLRHASVDLLEDGSARDRIKGIAEVELNQDTVLRPRVVLQPVPRSVHDGFGARRDADSNLQGPKLVTGGLTDVGTQKLPDQSAKNLAYSYRPDASRFGEGVQGGTSQVRGEGCRGLATGQEVAQRGQVRRNRASVSSTQAFAQVVGAKARRPRGRGALETANGLNDGLSTELRHSPWTGDSKASKVWQRAVRMFGLQGGQSGCVTREGWLLHQRVAGTREPPLSCQAAATGVAGFRRKASWPAAARLRHTVFP